MTANELADELDKSRQKPYTSEHLVGKAANMLRQFGLAESIVKQQALDIEEWKRKYKDMHNLATQAMSKSTSIRKRGTKEMSYHGKLQVLKQGKADKEIQHWAYLQLEKELTDNEIVWLWCDCEKDGTEATYIKFARAILRKAK